MIKRKNPFGFYCVILILNLSRLISLITILISKVCRVWFLKCIFDFQNLMGLISKVFRVWFLKWHFWFPKFIAFDFSNNTFDFQNLSRLISQMTLWHFRFPKFIAFDFSNDTFDFQNLSRLISQMTLLISKIYRVWFLKWHFWFPKFVAFDFSNNTFDFQNETDMDDIHVTVLWVVSLTHGKARATLSQLLHHNRTRQRACFSEKRGMCPWKGYRVWVSSSLF